MKKLILIAAIAGMACSAHAIQLTFFGEDDAGGSLPVPNSDASQADFLSNLVGVGTETFDSIASGTAFPLALNFGAAGTATMSGAGMAVTTGPITGTFPISGTQHIQGFTDAFNIAFSAPVAAFGFYGTDIGDVGGQLSLNLVSGGVLNIAVPHTLNNNGNAFFFGIIDTDNLFTSVSFTKSGTGSGDRFGFDNMTIGSLAQVSVPDSGTTVVLLGLTLTLLGAYRRKFGRA